MPENPDLPSQEHGEAVSQTEILAETRAEIRDVLRQTEVMRDWPDALVEAIARETSLHRFKPGECLSRYDERGRGMWIIAAGSAGRYRQFRNGRRMLCDLLMPGHVSDAMTVFDDLPAPFDVVARAGCRALLVPKPVLLGAVRRDPDRLFAFLLLFTRRARLEYETTVARTLNSRRCFLAKFLVSLARQPLPAGGPSAELGLDVTQDELASLMGVTRQTVNVELRKLIDEDLVVWRYRKIHIPDLARLIAVAEEDEPFGEALRAGLFARPPLSLRAPD